MYSITSFFFWVFLSRPGFSRLHSSNCLCLTSSFQSLLQGGHFLLPHTCTPAYSDFTQLTYVPLGHWLCCTHMLMDKVVFPCFSLLLSRCMEICHKSWHTSQLTFWKESKLLWCDYFFYFTARTYNYMNSVKINEGYDCSFSKQKFAVSFTIMMAEAP